MTMTVTEYLIWCAKGLDDLDTVYLASPEDEKPAVRIWCDRIREGAQRAARFSLLVGDADLERMDAADFVADLFAGDPPAWLGALWPQGRGDPTGIAMENAIENDLQLLCRDARVTSAAARGESPWLAAQQVRHV